MNKKKMQLSDYMALLSVALLTFIGIMAETALNVTFPELARVFKIALDTTQWLTAGYLLMVTIMMGTTAYLLKRFSTKHLQLAAVVAFIIGDIGSAMAPNFTILMLSRLLQAVATGIATPTLFHLVFTQVPREKLGMMTGMAGMIISFAPALGPTYGGWVSTSMSWRALFWLLLPIAAISLLLGQHYIPAGAGTKQVSFNLPSFGALALAMFTWVYAFSLIGNVGITPKFYLLMMLALGLFGTFGWLNFRGSTTLMDLRIFKHYEISLNGVTYFSLQFINIGLSTVIPVYAQYTLHASPLVAGLILLPGTILGAVMSPISGALADRMGFALPVITGSCLLTLGTASFLLFQAKLTPAWIAIFFMLLRAGFNMTFANTISNLSTKVPVQSVADVSSIFNVLQQFAGATGVVFLASLMAQFENHGTGSMAMRIYLGGHIDFMMGFILALVVLVANLVNYHFQYHLGKEKGA